ncbi:uncharacterized protein KY384_002198 [Bacidia gigantensis]|uniref:uncharacterized protein n=1 Tax=Bacidia gigantensis TaxID=2732470 RepID=UPI001D03D648|nr:uncharacterized protein KY384_002198 [Bacidia gigantensis]KAG8533415.1 hypothetical protein KY384_002198 [Bacidia gigantensis]
MALPESPRWHLLKARRLERRPQPDSLRIERHYEAAFHALRQLRQTKLQAARDLFLIDAWLRMEEISEESYNPEANRDRGFSRLPWRPWRENILELFRQARCRRAITAGLIVMSLQQLCGVNVLAYYSSSVFWDSLDKATVGKDNTALSVRTAVDTRAHSRSRINRVGLLTGIYWGLNSLMALTWPPMQARWGYEGSFGFYAILNLIGWFLIILFVLAIQSLRQLTDLPADSFVPETSRYKLEELDRVFNFSTKQIMEKGKAQVIWLVSGGWFKRKPYPELVHRSADRDSNGGYELDDFDVESDGGIGSDNDDTIRLANSGSRSSARHRRHPVSHEN